MNNIALKGVHVDRSDELARFTDMINGAGSTHVLLIQAAAGMGKSSLLREFWDSSERFSRAFVDLKTKSHSVESVLGELASQQRSSFSHFFERLEQLSTGSPVLAINNSKIQRSQFEVVQGNTEASDQREMRRQLLTDAFYADLTASNRRADTAVIIFDTYEDASSDLQDWLTRLFLSRARGYRWLVIVVAGRSIPVTGVGWEEWCIELTLRPLGREHMGEYLRKVKLDLSEEQTAVLYGVTKGVPLDLSTAVLRLLTYSGLRGAGDG
jgi:hypothetical protein